MQIILRMFYPYLLVSTPSLPTSQSLTRWRRFLSSSSSRIARRFSMMSASEVKSVAPPSLSAPPPSSACGNQGMWRMNKLRCNVQKSKALNFNGILLLYF